MHGTVERVTFHSDESGFCVLRVRSRDRREPLTVVGTAPSVSPGEVVEAIGTWERDRKHGPQFRADELRIVPPSTRDGVEKYLASGAVHGVGPHFAKKLVAAFGERVFDVIEREPHRLTALPGIGPKRVARLRAAWSEQKSIREILVFLQSHGVGTARAARIHKLYGDEAIERVTENPYRLARDVRGIGFDTADRIAESLGIARDAPMRARAGVRHVLRENAERGSCAMVRTAAVERTAELLQVTTELVEGALADEIADGAAVADTIPIVEGDAPASPRDVVYLTPLHRAETAVAERLREWVRGVPPWGRIDAEKALPWVEQKTAMRLSASQREAVRTALRGPIAVVTGGPGVGKTTLIRSLLAIVRAKKTRVALAAPTGRAAKRLAESTGIEAKTIHRLLEFDPHTARFKRCPDRPLDTELVVLDEASMVDIVLFHALLAAIPRRAALWIVGDVDQIPSVGPGAVLGDVIDARVVPTVRLTEIFRQAETSRIIVNAHRIRRGESPELGGPGDGTDFVFVRAEDPERIADRVVEIVARRIPERFRMDPVRDVHVLTPMNRASLGTHGLNARLQEALNPGAEPSVIRHGTKFARGDKVLQTVNDYDKEVFNGDIGRITAVDGDGGVTVRFDGRFVEYEPKELDDLMLAYATTIHKSQGSEYPAVVLCLATQHFTMLERNLLYTGVTRGKRLVVLVGQRRAVELAIANERHRARVTGLRARLTRETERRT